jgi:hypothetical protein
VLPAFQDIAAGDVLAAGNERGVISSVQWPGRARAPGHV